MSTNTTTITATINSVIADIRNLRTEVMATVHTEIFREIEEIEYQLSYPELACDPNAEPWSDLQRFLQSPIEEILKRALWTLISVDWRIHREDYYIRRPLEIKEVEKNLLNCVVATRSTHPYVEHDFSFVLRDFRMRQN
ncbi:hypothetical protein KSC_020630 [Ktedonobacter sp. SOSP1-52]|uniref:hypothetical protein n=1 Tax=Ktedonobacter sp. SOSP1-52 TaxID=2778366 RepID=UPI0019155BB8|nr:hypothetical protein [Ktedonobacter sp. SOSP1-52]GHO63171.1 hypothetical protein KSC_020630 [Ktedonobacter sp. SOSP1-52]